MSLTLHGTKTAAEHGQHIFIYCHVRTKQVIYSLDRVLHNHQALKQLPFLGKQTKPRALRKDSWRPLATVTFPTGHQGLTAYRELREFRKRHEHEWTYEQLNARTRLKAGERLRDQKANSIADLAAVLETQAQIAQKHQEQADRENKQKANATANANTRYQEIGVRMRELRSEALSGNEDARKEYKQLKNEKIHIRKALRKPMPHLALKRKYHPLNDPTPVSQRRFTREQRQKLLPRMSMAGLRIQWANTLDAEFARTWPKSVVHEALQEANLRTRHMHPPTAAPSTNLDLEAIENSKAQATLQESSQPETTREPSMLERLVVRLRDGAN